MVILYIVTALIAATSTLIFTLLKVSCMIAWAWLWVLSPIWILWTGMAVLAIVVVIRVHMETRKAKARRSGQVVKT